MCSLIGVGVAVDTDFDSVQTVLAARPLMR